MLIRGVTVYATERGKTIVLDETRDKFMIDDLLALKLKLDHVVKGPFESSAPFVDCLRITFQVRFLSRCVSPTSSFDAAVCCITL